MSAVITRVNAKIPGVNAPSAWSRRMEFTPSEPQAFCAVVRVIGAKVPGTSVVPLTPVHTAIDCVMACSISFKRPVAVWFWVRIVTGFVPSTVLHCSAIDPGAMRSCEGTGHAEPPETLAGWRTSGTISLKAYPSAPGIPQTP
jgi:hypothetical protein